MIEDARLSSMQKRVMQHNLDSGMPPYEAKLRALCIAAPREIDEAIRAPHAEYPRLVYHGDPEGLALKEITRVVNSKEEHAAATKEGYTDAPQDAHLEAFQNGAPLKAAKAEPGEPEVPKESFAKLKRKVKAAKAE